MVAPNVSASKRTSRLASTAPLASFSVTDAEATSPAQSVAAVIAALFSGAQIELAAGVIWITFEAMVAGVTVATTADVAPSASVTVKVTGAAVSTFLGTMTNDVPAMVAGTGTSVLSLDLTVNGPLPPVIPIVLGVLPKATKAAGPATNVPAAGVVGDDELDPPPHPPSKSTLAEASAARLREAAVRVETILWTNLSATER